MSDLLWTDRGAEQARHSLRQTLLVLRRELRDAGEDLIRSDDGVLSFRPDAVATDVGRFRVLATSRDRADLAEAAELYAGPLLARFQPVAADFDDWVDRTRGEIEEVSLDVLGRLADCCLAAGDAHSAVLTTERMLVVDPLREDVHRRLIEAYARVGRRADAIRQYNACVEMLRRDLDVGPSAETEALIGRMRGNTDGWTEVAPVVAENVTAQHTPPAIAVLPFQQFDGDPLPSHLSDGLVADIICQLVGLRELSVISHGSTISLREHGISLRETGDKLGARYLVRGAMRKSGAHVRLTTELVEAQTSKLLWARTHDTRSALTFADQDRVVGQIVNTLAPRVREAELLRIRGKRPVNLTVYEKALLVREYLTILERDSFREAKLLLDDILHDDPSWGEAHALAADWHGLVVAQGWSEDRTADISHVDSLTRRALTLDAENIRALIFYGHRKSLLYRDYNAALKLFQKALEVAPGSAQGLLWSSYTFSFIGDAEQAIHRAEQALALSPCDREAHRFLAALCIAYYTAGDYEAAAEWGMRALAEPLVGRTTGGWVAAALAAAGKTTEASLVASQTMARWPSRRVSEVVANHPYRDLVRRQDYGSHLLAAGFPT